MAKASTEKKDQGSSKRLISVRSLQSALNPKMRNLKFELPNKEIDAQEEI
jgi:hypothetical protein